MTRPGPTLSPEVAAYAAARDAYEQARSRRVEAHEAYAEAVRDVNVAWYAMAARLREAKHADPAGLAEWESGRSAQESKP